MRSVIFAILLFVSGVVCAQEAKLKTVHLVSDEMDLYLDVPDSSEVQSFDVHKEKTVFGKRAVVSIYLKEGSELGDIYMETFTRNLKDLEAIKDHGSLRNKFKNYYRHTDTDLIMEFQNPVTKNVFYEFHYVTEIGGKQFYFCSDPSKEYTLDQVLAMHKIAETLRNKK